VDSKYLTIDTSTKLVNSVVISDISSAYAPRGTNLIASTSLSKLAAAEVNKAVAKIWKTDDLQLVASYEIKESLPFRKSSGSIHPKVGEKLYLAGDHMDLPSQNGAMRSGRRAALEVIKDLKLN
jgi:monoamine oxidase